MPVICFGNKHLAKEERDIGEILSLTRNSIVNSPLARRGETIMKPKKLKKRIQQLEKRLREGTQKLARLKRKLHESESAKSLKAARKSAARATALSGKKSPEQTAETKKPSDAKNAKRKLNLSPERRAQLAAAMKARWAAKRAAARSNTTSTGQNSPTPSTQSPDNRADGA